MSKMLESHGDQVHPRPPGNVLSLSALWLRCFALGTMNTPVQVAGFLRGQLCPTRPEYNLVAVALSEYLMDIGVSQFVPYIDDDSPTYLNASWSRSAAIPSAVAWCAQ